MGLRSADGAPNLLLPAAAVLALEAVGLRVVVAAT